MPASPKIQIADSEAQIELERLYDDHAPALFAFILSLIHSDADARDVLQDLFCRIAIRPGLLTGVRNERPQLLQQLCLGIEEKQQETVQPAGKTRRRETPGAFNWHKSNVQFA